MEKLPIEYLKLQSLELRYRWCCEYKERYEKEKMTYEESYNYFMTIKSYFNFYWKYLQYLYKKDGVKLTFPREIISRARRDNLISDANVWLEYIDDFNRFWLEFNADIKQKMLEDFLKKYYTKIETIHDFAHTQEREAFMREYQPVEEEIMQEKLFLDEGEPVYSAEVVGITERSYEKLMDYFKSKSEIARVWAHGSRLYNTSARGSDLDLIIDCPEENWKTICRELINLPVPYIIDMKNLNIATEVPYIKSIMYLGTKKIYERV